MRLTGNHRLLPAVLAMLLIADGLVQFAMPARADDAKTANSNQAADQTLTALFAARSALDRELNAEVPRDAIQAEATRRKIAQQAADLVDKTNEFADKNKAPTNLVVLTQMDVYGFAVDATLGGPHAKGVVDLVENLCSSLFLPSMINEFSISRTEAMDIQAAGERAFVQGAIAALRFAPTNANLESLWFFTARAQPGAGQQLARAIVDNTNITGWVKESVQKVLRREFTIGKPMTLDFTNAAAAMKNKVTLVIFWRPGCAPCMSEVPELKELYRQHRERGFEIIGVCLEEDEKRFQETVRAKEIPWLNYLAAEGWTNKLAVQCGVSGIPDGWLLDRKGVVREIGAREKLDAKVSALLAEPP